MNKLQEGMIAIDLTEEIAQRRQASRSHFMYKDGAREATKDIMEYLQEQGLLCKASGPIKKKDADRLCNADKESGVGRVACANIHEYLNNLYYTGKTRFFKE
jgi:hypothetical protein